MRTNNIYIVTDEDVRSELADVLAADGHTMSEDDVDECCYYVSSELLDAFHEFVQNFVDENWDRWDNEEED